MDFIGLDAVDKHIKYICLQHWHPLFCNCLKITYNIVPFRCINFLHLCMNCKFEKVFLIKLMKNRIIITLNVYIHSLTPAETYSGLVGSAVLLSILRAVLFYFLCVNAARKLHNSMFGAILRAPVRFFDRNPIG